jgi:hypothetical protein
MVKEKRELEESSSDKMDNYEKYLIQGLEMCDLVIRHKHKPDMAGLYDQALEQKKDIRKRLEEYRSSVEKRRISK